MKRYNNFFHRTLLATLITTSTGILWAVNSNSSSQPLELAQQVTPAQITPNQINPTTITPRTINPPVINPTVINPTVINPTVVNPTVINPTVINPTVINPPVINPTVINPTVINPTVINPPIIRPQIVNPTVINPSVTTPSVITPSITTPTNTTPSTTTPVIITPSSVTPGSSSAAESTSITMPNSAPTAIETKQKKTNLPSGMVIKTNGKVFALISNKTLHSLKPKSLLYSNQIIMTKKESNAGLRFNDGTFLLLGPDSALEIKKFNFTIPAKGQTYTGSPKDRAELKLIKGNLITKLGALALFNKPSAFAIVTPRGRIELANAKANPNVELIYNNKDGLTVKAVGILSNSKGQVTLTEQNYGLTSAVVGSSPTTTTSLPFIFTDVIMRSTASSFSFLVDTVNTGYSENIITEEENSMESDAADTSGDSDASSDGDVASLTSDEEGDDEGNADDIEDADDDND